MADLFEIVVPTIGRPSLRVLLDSVVAAAAAAGVELPSMVVVDDRRQPGPDLDLGAAGSSCTVLRSSGRGPAAARNAGWRACRSDWVEFLDDDVVVSQSWLTDLLSDLAVPAEVGGSQGRIEVPLPSDRRPTDWERGTAGLATASWITADLAYRRTALIATGGFDERFPRAFREDADLALRVLDHGYQLTQGSRRTTHPVRPATWWASLKQQRGNADDVLMRRLHGADWRRRANAALGRRPQHLATTTLGLAALIAAAAGRRRVATVAAAGWASCTAEFCWRRIKPGPRDRVELAKMLTTSVAIPPAAVWFWLQGIRRHSKVAALKKAQGSGEPKQQAGVPAAVLVDRDGTIVRDVPFNGDPALVQPMPGARQALDRLRAAGLPIAVISNQSGIGQGLLTAAQVTAVNARIEELLGPFEGWFICPHAPTDGCECRKPGPDLVLQAAQLLGVEPKDCVIIGDIGADMGSAAACGARGILVPTSVTKPAEVRSAPERATDLAAAVDLVLAGWPAGVRGSGVRGSG